MSRPTGYGRAFDTVYHTETEMYGQKTLREAVGLTQRTRLAMWLNFHFPEVDPIGAAGTDRPCLQNAYPFKTPVDTKLYKDYLTRVSNPMDLSTVKARLDAGQYLNNLDAYLSDVRQIFKNAYLYNAAGTDVYAMAKQLEVNPTCQQLGSYQSPFLGDIMTHHMNMAKS